MAVKSFSSVPVDYMSPEWFARGRVFNLWDQKRAEMVIAGLDQHHIEAIIGPPPLSQYQNPDGSWPT